MKEQYSTGCIVCQAGRCNFEWDHMLYFPAFCKYMKLIFARKWALFALYSCFIRKTLITIHSCSSVWVVDLIAVMYRSWPAGFFVCVCVCACACARARTRALDVTTSIETVFAAWCVIVYGRDFVVFIWSQIGVVCLCHALLGLIWWEWFLL